MRPASIVQFERLFLGALALDAISYALNWNAMVSLAKTYPELGGAGPALVFCMIAGSVAIGVLLWYFVAQRASVVAKWLVAGWFVISTMMLALSLFRGISFALPVVIGWAAYALRAWSISYLFKPDAEAWFTRK